MMGNGMANGSGSQTEKDAKNPGLEAPGFCSRLTAIIDV
jgi:hypothetical protein